MIPAAAEIAGIQRWTVVGLLFGADFISYLDRAILSVVKNPVASKIPIPLIRRP
jgi:hypothetical protein